MPLPWIDLGADPAPGTAPKWIPNLEPIAMRGFWKLNDAGAVCVDSSGNGFTHGYSGTTSKLNPGPVAGMLSAGFDGASGWVNVSSFSSNKTLGWSYAVWLNPFAAAGSTTCAMSTYGPSPAFLGYGQEGGIGGPQRVWMGFHDGDWRYALDPVDTPLNTWTHYVGTFDRSNIRLYRNGIQVASVAYGPGGGINDAFIIARRWDSGIYFPGWLAEARYYERGLTAVEALAVYQRGAGIARPWTPLGVVT